MMIFILMILIFLISLIMVLLNFIISEFFLESKNIHSSFECGMENNLLTRIPFSLQFFLIGLIFIIFDLEVIILLNFLPFTSMLKTLMIFIMFMSFVFLSLVYEWKFNKLLWLK